MWMEIAFHFIAMSISFFRILFVCDSDIKLLYIIITLNVKMPLNIFAVCVQFLLIFMANVCIYLYITVFQKPIYFLLENERLEWPLFLLFYV